MSKSSIKLYDLIVDQTMIALEKQNDDGSFPPGHNGPYRDIETPVRNTAHWLFTLCELYKRTGKKRYYHKANKAVDYLLSEEARPMNASFWCRKNPEKDFCNGVMGQAWVLEALIKASNILERDECYRVAEEVFLLHPWDDENKIWGRVNVDGSYTGPDVTFNHQLWFGAIAGFLTQTPSAIENSQQFFDIHAQNVSIYNNGVIYHTSPTISYKIDLSKPEETLKKIKQLRNLYFGKNKLWHKSAGYHAFNLYAFGLFKSHLPNHHFWESNKFKKILSVIDKKEFIEEQVNNKYSFPYNPTGFEIAFALETFKPENRDIIEWWIEEQFKQAKKVKTSKLPKKYIDELTLRARIYELTRLENNYNI